MDEVSTINYVPVAGHEAAAKAFFKDHWLSDTMIISSGDYRFDDLAGVVALAGDQLVGLITYAVHGNALSIVSVNSVLPHHSIGKTLMKVAEEKALAAHLTKIDVFTTNDNLLALRFYQRLGYRMTKVLRGSIDLARERKPEIPVIGENGIPVHDEVLLSKLLVQPE